MMPIIEVAIASVAAIISILSLKTQRAISHLGVGKSFWIPVALSGLLFITGSVISILNLTGFSLVATIPMIDEIAQTTRLIAMGVLLIGVTSYSRQVSKNLRMMPESMKHPEKLSIETTETKRGTRTPTEPKPLPVPVEELPIQERLDQPEFRVQVPQECQHQFGYLRTLPRNASLPDECLRCNKILDCRHGFATTPKPQPQTQPNPPAEA